MTGLMAAYACLVGLLIAQQILFFYHRRITNKQFDEMESSAKEWKAKYEDQGKGVARLCESSERLRKGLREANEKLTKIEAVLGYNPPAA